MLMLRKLKQDGTIVNKNRLLRAASELDLMVFSYALDPYKIYHLKNFPVMEIDTGEPDIEMFDLLDQILEGDLRGNSAKDAVNEYASKNGSLIKQICQKNLRCGVSAKTVNKIYPGFIPMFEVQLAKEVPVDDIAFPKLVQLKYDGVRIIAIKTEHSVKFRTRNGKEVALPKLSKILAKLEGDIVLDGEMTTASGKLEDRTTVSGMINSAMHGGSINEESLCFNVFDAMLASHWESLNCPIIYSHRLKMVRLLVEEINNPMVVEAFTFKAKDKAMLERHYDTIIAQGFEGLILKDEQHLYSFKRSKDWIKLKETKTADIACIDIQDGEGKYEGMIGALICKGEVEGKTVLVKVGSGLTDADRELPDTAYVDKTIEVKYNTVIRDSSTGRYSLFLPRFVMVRYDK